jgi:inorganic triphosphatase YgiF
LAQRGKEIELKLQVPPRELRKLKDARTLHRKPREEDLVSVYFDTPKHKLARNDVTLRVRRHGDKFPDYQIRWVQWLHQEA